MTEHMTRKVLSQFVCYTSVIVRILYIHVHIHVHNFSSIYSEVPLIRPPMVLVESGLNREQVSLMRSFTLVLKQVFLIVRVVLILGGFYGETSLYLSKQTTYMYI